MNNQAIHDSAGWKWLQQQLCELCSAEDWPVTGNTQLTQQQHTNDGCHCTKMMTHEWAQFTIATQNWVASEVIPRRAFESGLLRQSIV